METEPKLSHWKKGRLLTKSSWRVLHLDKELVLIPLINIAVSLAVLVPFAAIALTNVQMPGDGSFSFDLGNWAIPFWFSLYLVLTTVGNFFAATILAGALHRFNGGDPTVRGSLSKVARRWKPLLGFSIMMATVGYILSLLEERLPFVGKIFAYLADVAWSVANFFSLAVIVSSEKDISPLGATRQSASIIKKVWSESVVAQLGIGLVAALYMLSWTMLWSVMVGFSFNYSPNGAAALGFGVFGVLGLLVMGLVFGVLGEIAKAAVYHYAVTGESPLEFDKKLLRASLTPKKARKIFSS